METQGKDRTQVECKETDDNQGNIRQRLRDRSLLRKRKAEAEAKTAYQVQGKRQTSTREKSSSGRVGRPKKTEPRVPLESTSVGELLPPQATSLPESTEHEPPPAFTFSSIAPSFTPVFIQPEAEVVLVSPEVEKLDKEQVLIEDMGPDEQEDIQHPHETSLLGLGTQEELPDNNQTLATPQFSLPSQEDNLPSSVS